jgi:hypothetical protein
MAKINAKTTGGGGIETVGDASGVLELQSDGTTVINATTVSGNPRITGDFSNATQANRTAFQSSTANGNTVVASIPNGTASTTAWNAFNNSVITNASLAQMLCTSSEASIRAERTGTGAYLPMTFQTGGSERMRIEENGNVRITQTAGRYTVDVTDGATAIANNGTVDFSNASGMLIVNNYNNGNVTIWLCGGTSTLAVASAGGTVGSFAYNAGINGYRWTNNSGSAATFGFFFVRTRGGA